eukprot:754856-Hanusia_phi.AAC.3
MSTTSTSKQGWSLSPVPPVNLCPTAKTVSSTTRESRRTDDQQDGPGVMLPQDNRTAANTVRKQGRGDQAPIRSDLFSAMTSMNFVETPGAGMLHRLALHGSAQAELEQPDLDDAVMPELDVNAYDDSGRRALHLTCTSSPAACRHGALALCRMQWAGRNMRGIDTKKSSGYTPLHFACESGCSEVVASLIALKADVNAAARIQDATQHFKGESKTPLHVATSQGNIATLQLLLEGQQVGTMKEVRTGVGEANLTHVRCGQKWKSLTARGTRPCIMQLSKYECDESSVATDAVESRSAT